MDAGDHRGGRRAAGSHDARSPNAQRHGTAAVETVTGNRKANRNPQSSVTSSRFVTQGDHVPLAGYNAQEVEKMLVNGVDQKVEVYVPDAQKQQNKSGPWMAKAGAMANGRDFWLELRKQVGGLQQTGGISQGG